MRKVISTDSGMYALWNTASFSDVVDYDTWEPRLCEDADIEKEIAAGTFVPINIGADGVSEIEVRTGTANQAATLSDRERKHLVVHTVQPYLLVSSGQAHFGGIEHVQGTPSDACGNVALQSGQYAVEVYLIDWQAESGMLQADDTPALGALPDFVVLVNPFVQSTVRRLLVETFER